MEAARDSSSIICNKNQINTRLLIMGKRSHGLFARTFFCKRTTLVHFFSRRPSYFLTVLVSSTSSGRLSSSRSAAAVLGKLFAERYAMIDLCLPIRVSSGSQASEIEAGRLAALQLVDSSIFGSFSLSSRPLSPLVRGRKCWRSSTAKYDGRSGQASGAEGLSSSSRRKSTAFVANSGRAAGRSRGSCCRGVCCLQESRTRCEWIASSRGCRGGKCMDEWWWGLLVQGGTRLNETRWGAVGIRFGGVSWVSLWKIRSVCCRIGQSGAGASAGHRCPGSPGEVWMWMRIEWTLTSTLSVETGWNPR